MDIHAFHQQVAVVFQDFARFPATLRKNIGFGRLSALSDGEAVLVATGKCGQNKLMADLPGSLKRH